ncbi:MAG: chromosomal replication initiator protein DnaA [Planctomycetes bacterium]|nr:chromosomal replication initiator protein DnaA [Planctomycetota bacterium]
MTDLAAPEAWDGVLAWVHERIVEQEFNRWFRDLRCESIAPDQVTLRVPSKFFKEWMEREYLGLLRSALLESLTIEPRIHFTIVDRISSEPDSPLDPSRPSVLPLPHQSLPQSIAARDSAGAFSIPLNEHYTFDNFVTGPCNRLAHAAAVAITESPSQAYNPFFLHSSVGLGKTHLMQAICHVFQRRYPTRRILYLSCEEFVNQFIRAIEHKQLETFRHKYRHVDLLLIDDIHFLADKERTQEEFFHTFNSLYNAQRQIVLSSDSHPKEIPTLEDRLVSRFKWGLVTRMDPPAYETRVAIIKTKARLRNHVFPDDVVDFVAQNLSANIRELEGAVTKIIGNCVLLKQPIDLDLARSALRDVMPVVRRIHISDIQDHVVRWFNIRPQDLVSHRRTKTVTFPRQVAMYLARRMTDLSLTEIGHHFGDRDHTTVMHAVTKLESETSRNPDMAATIANLVQAIETRN